MMKNKKTKKFYVGQDKVKNIAIQEKVDLVGVLYENGKNEDFTLEQWESVKSDKVYDSSLIAIRKFKGLIQGIINLMIDSRVKVGDFGWVIQNVNQSLDQNINTGIAKKFGKKHMNDTLLYEIDLALKE